MKWITALFGFISPVGSVFLMYWKEIAVVSLAALSFWAGYDARRAMDARGELVAARMAISDFKKTEEYMSAIASAYEKGKSDTFIATKFLHQTLKVSREKNHTVDCGLSTDELQAINH